MGRRMGGGRPAAVACIQGSAAHPDIRGRVAFYPMKEGTLVAVSLQGLPCPCETCGRSVLGLHIHEGKACAGNSRDPFADAGGHYNPCDRPHPLHAGDLPPIFAGGGRAFSAVYTDRFQVCDVIGRTVILHAMADDFTTQPAGDSGEKIACGVIRKMD